MEVTLAAVSDFGYVDRMSGKLYILGVVRYIFAQDVPTVHDRLTVTFALEEFTRAINGPVMARVHIQDADGGDVSSPTPPIPLTFQPVGPGSVGQSMCQFTIEINNLQLPTFGDYTVRLIRAEDATAELARAKFTVHPFPQRVG